MNTLELKELIKNDDNISLGVDNRFKNTNHRLRLLIERGGKVLRKSYALNNKTDIEIHNIRRELINLRDSMIYEYTTNHVRDLNVRPSTEFPFLLVSDKGQVYNTQSNVFLSTKLVKGDKYKKVSFEENGKRRTVRVHILVADAFLEYVRHSRFNIGGIKPNTIVVNHIDKDKLNNNVDNLELITNRENIQYSDKTGESGYKGVSSFRDTFAAYSCISSTQFCLGYDNDKENLHIMYMSANDFILELEDNVPAINLYKFVA